MSVGIIVKSYEHINRSFSGWDTPNGRHVRSKDHYDRLCKEQGMVSFEKAEELAQRGREAKQKPYTISKDSEEIIREARLKADRKGNVKLSDRQIEVLVKRKAIGKKIPDYMKLPSEYSKKGGFA